MKKLLSISLCLCLVLLIVPAFATAESSETAAKHETVGSNVFLGNDRMEMGITSFGTFGSTEKAPTTFHPADGFTGHIGLRSSPWDATTDYFLPGRVDEGYSFAWKDSGGNSVDSMARSNAVGSVTSSRLTAQTADASDNSTLAAVTSGLAKGTLKFTQTISVPNSSGVADMTVTIHNSSKATVSNVQYYRGFDPDQGRLTNQYATNNYYYKDQDGAAWVIASTNAEPVGSTSFEDFTAAAKSPFIYMAPTSDDYKVVAVKANVNWLQPTDVAESGNGYVYGTSHFEDKAIGIRFDVGSMAPDAEVTIHYKVSLESNMATALKEMAPHDTPAKTFVATFHANTADAVENLPEPQTVTAGTAVTCPEEPTRTGYVFGGWFTEQECRNAWDFTKELDSDTQLYAKWMPKAYAVTLSAEREGYALTPASDAETVNYGENYTFGVAVSDGYRGADMIVKANGVPLSPSAGTYSVKITAPTTIAVEGVRDTDKPAVSIAIGTDRWSEFLHTITFGRFFNKTQRVTVTAQDAGSGLASTEYLVSKTAFATADEITGTWIQLPPEGGQFDILPEQNALVYVRSTDRAGNVSVICSDGVVLDTTSPEILGVTDGATYYTTQPVTVSDEYLQSVEVNGQEVRSPLKLAGDCDAEYQVKATDKAGNISAVTVFMKPISAIAAPISGLTEKNVTAADQSALAAVKSNAQSVDASQATAQEKEKLADVAQNCQTLLERVGLAETAASSSAIQSAKGLDFSSLLADDKPILEQAVSAIQSALANYGGNYSVEEKSALDQLLTTYQSALRNLDQPTLPAAEDNPAAEEPASSESDPTPTHKDPISTKEQTTPTGVDTTPTTVSPSPTSPAKSEPTESQPSTGTSPTAKTGQKQTGTTTAVEKLKAENKKAIGIPDSPVPKTGSRAGWLGVLLACCGALLLIVCVRRRRR